MNQKSKKPTQLILDSDQDDDFAKVAQPQKHHPSANMFKNPQPIYQQNNIKNERHHYYPNGNTQQNRNSIYEDNQPRYNQSNKVNYQQRHQTSTISQNRRPQNNDSEISYKTPPPPTKSIFNGGMRNKQDSVYEIPRTNFRKNEEPCQDIEMSSNTIYNLYIPSADKFPESQKNTQTKKKISIKQSKTQPYTEFRNPQNMPSPPSQFSSIPPNSRYETTYSQNVFTLTNNQSNKPQNQPQKINKNFKILNQVNLVQNINWIQNINKNNLLWQNFRSSPLEIQIMLQTLEQQSSPQSVKELFSIRAVSEPLPLSQRFQSKSDLSLNNYIKDFPVYRQIRGDGNCFYRAFNFSFLQMALSHRSSIYFLKFLFEISNFNNVKFETNLKNKVIYHNPNTSPQKMRAFVLHRLLLLYSYRVTLQQSKDPKKQSKIINLLQQVFNEPPYCFDAFLIIGIKNYIVSQLKKDSNFDKDSQYGRQTIEQISRYGEQCQLNQYPIKILSDGLQICLSLVQEINNKFKFQPYGNKASHEKVILYFRPGHYDVIYYEKKVYADIVKKNKRIG